MTEHPDRRHILFVDDEPAIQRVVERMLRAGFPGVRGHHDLRTRTAGSRIFVNIHIELDGDQTLDEAHAIGAALRREIIRVYPQADVMIHKDPVGVERHPEDPRIGR